MFTLNGENVQLKELNFGDVLDLQELVKGLSETKQAVVMVSFMTGISVDEIRSMPPAIMSEIALIVEEVTKVFLQLEEK